MLDGLGDLFAAMQDYFAPGQSGSELILRLLGWLFSRIVVNAVTWIGEATDAGSGAGGGSILVQLPRALTLDEPWVRAGHALFSRVTGAALVGGFLLALLAAAFGGLLGFTSTEARSVVAVTVLLWYANRRALELVGYLLGLANTLAAQFADPTALLPGWNDLSDLQRGSGEGLMLFFTGVAGLLLTLVRWLTLLGVNILVVLMPLALLLALHPATRGLFSLWWRTLLGMIFVQVPMALAVGQGQALLARYGAGASGGALLAGVACFWLAMQMPRMVGKFAAMPGQTMAGLEGHAKRVGGFAVAGMLTKQGVGGTHDGLPAPAAPPPVYRPGPLQPLALAPPPPRRLPPPPPPFIIDAEPISVE